MSASKSSPAVGPPFINATPLILISSHDLASCSILHSMNLHSQLDWTSSKSMDKMPLKFKAVKSRASLMAVLIIFFWITLVHEDTFPSALFPSINLHLSEPHNLDCIQLICSLLLGEHYPLIKPIIKNNKVIISFELHHSGVDRASMHQRSRPSFVACALFCLMFSHFQLYA